MMEHMVNSTQNSVRAGAFRAPLATGCPISAEGLATMLGTSAGEVQSALDKLDRRGQVRRDDECGVVASCGLSVTPSRHELQTSYGLSYRAGPA